MCIVELPLRFPAGWIDTRFYALPDFPRTVFLFDGIARKYEPSELSTSAKMSKIGTEEVRTMVRIDRVGNAREESMRSRPRKYSLRALVSIQLQRKNAANRCVNGQHHKHPLGEPVAIFW